MTYGLVMIVRDAAAQLARTLPTIRPHIATWTIVDTGSADDTMAVVERELAGVPGTLHQRPWVNFGHNRSEALALAHGTADWLILSDADMAWSIDDGFVPDPAVDQYMIAMGAGFSWRLPLVVSGRRPWRSVGAVHEYTEAADGLPVARAVTDAIRIAMPPVHATPDKLERYADLLRQDLAANPDNPRATFYLAQTLRELGEVDQARALYRRRMTMGGFEEETYYAAWRAATTVEELLLAWELRPTRLEALADALRLLNAAGSHHAAWLLSGVPLAPSTDSLFVHQDAWDWQIPFERSIAAWWVGERREFSRLTEQLLANPQVPDHIRKQVLVNAGL